MSGGNVSYNLRPNKYVERHLFIELLAMLVGTNDPARFVYISLGGPQMEDHRLVHQQLNLHNMISLESDEVIHRRQLFNRRPALVNCINSDTGSFITDFARFADEHMDNEFIIWLDYADPRARLDQLLEFKSLLRQLQHGDILKITLNANPATLGEKRSGEKEDEVRERRLAEFKAQLSEHFPTDRVLSESMTGRQFPVLLCQLVQRFALQAITIASTKIVPLAIFCYQDGNHQMMTITVQLMKGANVEENLQALRKAGWEYLPNSWEDVSNIRVPNLTAKERLLVEELLFTGNNEAAHKLLPFRFHGDEKVSLDIFNEYARHYRRYPSYFQVIL